MNQWRSGITAVAIILTVILGGCAMNVPTERYVSPTIQGASQRINLDDVQKAFWETRGKDLNSWMGAFEKRVNEIYEGKEVISLDATRKEGHLVVTGYINTQKKEGFVSGDDKLFSIEQTGDAANNEMPYRVAGEDGRTYYEGHHSILDNPFLQMMLLSHVMGGWGGRYYTPYDRTVVLQDYRNSYRTSPSWGQQQTLNRQFDTRFKSNAFGGLQSRTKFGSGSFSSGPGQSSRSWGGLGQSSTSAGSSSTSIWGGRRSSSSFGGGFRSSGGGWGGRRR
jgi:hypothetical protein